MELDKRIKALTDIQSVTDGCHDWELMNKKGYFADRLAQFQDLSKCEYGTYVDYREHDKCFHCEVELPDGTSDYNWFSYFIPEDSLLPEEEPEKKYRPFLLNEFLNRYRLGNTVYFRRIGYKEVKCAMFVEYVRGESPEENQIVLGNMRYTLAYLFKNHELSLEDIWQPFGVIEE